VRVCVFVVNISVSSYTDAVRCTWYGTLSCSLRLSLLLCCHCRYPVPVPLHILSIPHLEPSLGRWHRKRHGIGESHGHRNRDRIDCLMPHLSCSEAAAAVMSPVLLQKDGNAAGGPAPRVQEPHNLEKFHRPCMAASLGFVPFPIYKFTKSLAPPSSRSSISRETLV
jgi:hypothetical protein